MGKSEKIKRSKANHQIPFYNVLMDANATKRIKIRNRQIDHEATMIDCKSTQKILTEARRQLGDIEEEFALSSLCKNLRTAHLFAGLPEERKSEESLEQKNFLQESSSERTVDFFAEGSGNLNSVEDAFIEDPKKKAALVDLLREKITEKRTEINTTFSEAGYMQEDYSRASSIFKDTGVVLSRYRGGKLPKYFNFVPKLAAWEQVLELTKPDNWTAVAMLRATILFSCRTDEMAQRFYNLILLPRLRDDIAQCKKLNTHLYSALKRALFKPGPFFRGIVIPLCESGTCTKVEARIFSSVIAKRSIPFLASSCALAHISKLPYSDVSCLFMRVLIEKKYALPCNAVDYTVDYFLRFAKDDRPLPVMWHQCLLAFVRIYKNNISQEQQQELLNLLKVQKHHLISVEIRKELLSAA